MLRAERGGQVRSGHEDGLKLLAADGLSSCRPRRNGSMPVEPVPRQGIRLASRKNCLASMRGIWRNSPSRSHPWDR